MPDTFEFTIPSPTILLSGERTGSAVVDVTSRLDRHGSVRVEVLPGSGAEAGWFGAPEPAEFDLPVGETLRTTVPINVPADAAAGSFNFELRASAVDAPQVDFTVSPSLSMTVPEPVVPKGGIPSWIFILIGVLVVAVLGLAAYFLLRSDPEPPFPEAGNLVTMKVTDAQATLDEQQTLRVYAEQADPSDFCVLLQSPPPNTPTVSISVLAVPCPAPGPTVQTPDVLDGLCQNATVQSFCRDVEAFFGVDYTENAEWDEATASMIADFVEKFTQPGVIVGSVIGLPEAAAIDAVNGQGLATSPVADGSGGTQCVIFQHPFPEKPIATGGTVTLVTTQCPTPAATPDAVVLATVVTADFGNVCDVAPTFCTSMLSSGVGDDYLSSDDFANEMNSMVSAFRNRFTGDVVPKVTGSTLVAARTALEERGLEAQYAFPESNNVSPHYLPRCFNVVGQNPGAGTLIDNLSNKTVNLQLEEYFCNYFELDSKFGDDLVLDARPIDFDFGN